MKAHAVVLALLLFPQQAGKHKLLPGQGIDWKGDWEEARKEAAARNVPILFTVHKDN